MSAPSANVANSDPTSTTPLQLPKILSSPNQEEPLVNHFESLVNMNPAGSPNAPQVAPATPDAPLPSYYEQQLARLQNSIFQPQGNLFSKETTPGGIGAPGYGYTTPADQTVEGPPGVEVNGSTSNMSGQSLFYVDRTSNPTDFQMLNQHAGSAPGSVQNFTGQGTFNSGPRFPRAPRPSLHSLPPRPPGIPEDKTGGQQQPSHSNRYSPSNPTPLGGGFTASSQIRPHQSHITQRRDVGRPGGPRGPNTTGSQMPSARPGAGSFRPPTVNSPQSSQSRPESNGPPPPGATFEYHPTHWVAFSAPPSVISTMPPNSRLFMGNLASERTDRRELARIFAVYGNIAEIVLKGSYGFVQFDNVDACRRAMETEAGRKVAGMSIDLKISRDKRKDYGRRPGDDQGSRRDGGGLDRRDDERRTGRKDEWRRDDRDRRRRRERSSSWSSSESDDDYRRRDGRDDRRRDTRRRGARRSMSPPRQGKVSKWGPQTGNAQASPSKIQAGAFTGSTQLPTPTISTAPAGSGVFPLPVRFGANVPECQIIVLGEIDRAYLSQVEQTIRNAGIAMDTLFLSPKLSLRDVVHQMMAEGVRGIIFLERRHVATKTVSMQIFQGGGTVAEYDNASLDSAPLLIIRDRSVRPIVQSQFNAGGLGQAPQPQINSALAGVVANLLTGHATQPAAGGLDAQTLLSLVGALQQQQQPQQQPQLATLGQLTQGLGAQTLNPANSLAALGLGGLAGLGQPQQQAAVQQQPNLATMLSSLLSAQQSQTQGQQATQLQQVPQSQLQQRTQLGGLQNPMQASIQPLVSSALATQFGALSGSSTTGSLPAALANLQRMGVTQQPLANPAVGSTAPTSGTESVADILNRLKQLQQLHPGTSNPQSGAAGRG